MKVLIIKPSALGDIVLSLPLVYNLKKIGCKVDYIVFKEFSDLFELVDGIDNLFSLERKFYKKPIYFFNFIKELRKNFYDYVIDLQGLFRSGILAFFSKAKEKIAHSLCREFSYFFVKPVSKFSNEEHVVYRNLRTYEYITKNKNYQIVFPWKKEKFKNYYLFEKDKNFIYLGLSPLSTSIYRNYPLEFYPSLLKKIKKIFPNLKVVLFGTSKQKEKLKNLISFLENFFDVHFINLVGKTNLKELISNIYLCDYFLAPDTGPMHIAWSLGVKTVALFGSTSWIMKGPLKNGISVYKKIDCNPCEKSKPNCYFPKCMYSISQWDIIKAFEKLKTLK